MIEKTHTKGQRITVDAPGLRFHEQPGTIMSDYGLHPTAGGVQFWGYFIHLDSGEVLGASRHMLCLIEPKPAPVPKLHRGDLDRKVPWSACAWQPNA